jgi:enterochelin esterase-like enzyme
VSPDSPLAVVLLAGLAAVAALTTALIWDRVRDWRRWLIRPAAVLACLLTATASTVVGANYIWDFYGTWHELAGVSTSENAPSAHAVISVSSSGSRVVRFVVHGRASGLTLTAYAYLPPGYDDRLKAEQLPVLEVLDGYPGSPHVWFSALHAQSLLDQEIVSGRMAPTVVIFPYQSPSSTHDTECVDAVGGLAVDTFLAVDVPTTVIHEFRVRPDGAAWGLLGYSTGGYCSVNLAMRHPTRFAAAASLSGDLHPTIDATTGNLFAGDETARNLNDPLWRVAHLPPVPVALYLATGLDDRSLLPEIGQFTALARPPMRVTTAGISRTGHTEAAWRAMQPPAYDWISSWLAGPLPSSGLSR